VKRELSRGFSASGCDAGFSAETLAQPMVKEELVRATPTPSPSANANAAETAVKNLPNSHPVSSPQICAPKRELSHYQELVEQSGRFGWPIAPKWGANSELYSQW
jgi:hypothetical protein